jgi:hypothetical protein
MGDRVAGRSQGDARGFTHGRERAMLGVYVAMHRGVRREKSMLDLSAGPTGVIRGAMRQTRLIVVLAAVAMFLAACNRVDQGSIGFWDIFWSMVVFFVWVLYIFIFISIFMDIFRRNDLSGAWKVIWILFLFVIPFISALVYIIARPKVTAQDIQMATQAEAAQKAAAGVSKADELAKLQALKDAGTINEAQFNDLKAKLLA